MGQSCEKQRVFFKLTPIHQWTINFPSLLVVGVITELKPDPETCLINYYSSRWILEIGV